MTTREPASETLSPVRWVIPLALFATTFINWLDRWALSYALPTIAKEQGLSTAEEIGSNFASVVPSFFLGYGLSNIVLSPLAERFGPRRSIALAIVAFSICTALTAPLGGMILALVALRFALGLGEGIHFPMSSAIVSRWFPPSERSRANGMWIFGPQAAILAGPFLIYPLIFHAGWRPMFLVVGAAGLLVGLPVVLRFVRDDGPYARAASGGSSAPVLAPFRQVDYRLLLVTGSLSNVILYGVISWLPTYLANGRHVAEADQAGLVSAPYWAGAVAIPVWAVLGDKLNKRTLFAATGCGIAGISVYFAAQAADLTVMMALLSVSVFFQNAYQTAEFALVQRVLPPDRIGAGTGIYNGIAIIVGGAAGTLLIGKIVAATGDYNSGFMVVAAAGVLNAAVLAVLARRIRY
jgi:MFS family permease